MRKNEENKFLEIYLSIMENEKKNISIYFFCNFPVAGNEKKNVISFGAEIWNLGTAQIVLQYSRLYCKGV